MSVVRRFGRLHVEDERDKKFLLTPDLKRASGVTKRYWHAGRVLNQGSTPQCVAYSGYKYLTAGPVRNTHLPWKPAELYKHAQEHDEWPGDDYDGSSLRGLFKYLHKEGFVSEYRWGFDLETILSHVLTEGPLVLGSTWYSEMSTPRNGFIMPQGRAVGGHAYVIIGANRNKKRKGATERGAFRILNSWGRSWGQCGRAWMSFLDFEMLLEDRDVEACMAVEVDKD